VSVLTAISMACSLGAIALSILSVLNMKRAARARRETAAILRETAQLRAEFLARNRVS
jgi:hypothetical protein